MAQPELMVPPPAEPEAVEDPFHILAKAPPLFQPRVLKNGDTFLMLDHFGDAQAIVAGAEGLYHDDTRYLARLVFLVDNLRPLLLGSAIVENGRGFTVDVTNPDIIADGRLRLSRDSVHIARHKVLRPRELTETVTLTSYAAVPVRLSLSIGFAADFVDIFEVRGAERARRGELLRPRVEAGRVLLEYRGLDGVTRTTEIAFHPAPTRLGPGAAAIDVALVPHGRHEIVITVTCRDDAAEPDAAAAEPATGGRTHVFTSNEFFNGWVARSLDDVALLTTDTPFGRYPYAGIPWFSTAFGRDGLLTALQMLWCDPRLARGVLGYLAARQATARDDVRDARPGKILHEVRQSEMARLGEVPFGLYYGSIDSTPLFVMLAAAYHARTGDMDFIRSIWPAVEAAIGWIEASADGDGFVAYDRMTKRGLSNQGWKDSHDAIFHADGHMARAPIALCEVQAYVYAAYEGAAGLAEALGTAARSKLWRAAAERLRERFEARFWSNALGSYALAIDGTGTPCAVRTSNAGHALLAGIVAPDRARRLAATLLGHDMCTAWGIRTVAAGEPRYNPMSYHNGSIWPHDNALIGLGLARYRLKAELLRIVTALFDASLSMDFYRLPELYCGFDRREGQGPVGYPVACSPQAWSSAACLGLIGAMLGIRFEPEHRRICFDRPILPGSLDWLKVSHLTLGDASADIVFRRKQNNVSIDILRRSGDLEIILVA